MVWPHDIGDLDIMISHKKQIFSHTELEDILGYPGFVKIKTRKGNSEIYVETTYLKSSIPEEFNDILNLLKKCAPLSGMAFEVIPKPLNPATKINLLTNIPSLNEQWKSLPKVSDDQLAFMENLLRATVEARDPEKKEKMVKELSSAFKEIANQQPMQNFDEYFEVIKHIALLTEEKKEQLRQEESNESTSRNYQENLNGVSHIRTHESTRSKCPGKEDNQTSMKDNVDTVVKSPGRTDSETVKSPREIDVDSSGEIDVEPVKPPVDSSEEIDVEPVKPPEEIDVEPVESPLDNDVNADISETRKAFNDLISKLHNEAIFKGTTKEQPETESNNLNIYTKQTSLEEMDESAARKIGIDLVMAIKVVDGWPAICEEFLSREGRYWPSQEAMEKIKMCFIYVVVKHPPDMPEEEQEFCFR